MVKKKEDTATKVFKGQTVVNFLLDETGSMMNCKNETISGFNEYIQTLQNEKGAKIRFTLTKFNSDKVEVVYVNKKIENVSLLTEKTYQPNAMTPLLDAIGKTAKELDKKLDGVKGDRKILFVIMTDGYENWSKEYNYEAIKALIKDKEKQDWSFTFMGAGIDAWMSYGNLGLKKGNVMSFDKKNMKGAFARAGGATVMYASSKGRTTNEFFK